MPTLSAFVEMLNLQSFNRGAQIEASFKATQPLAGVPCKAVVC